MAAAREGDADRLKELIAKGVNMNAQDQKGESPLMAAAQNGHKICIKQLLEFDAQLNITDHIGNTALIHAIMNRKLECVKKLIAAGADVNVGSVPPLIYSIRSKSFESTNELLIVGADVNGKDENGNTALIEAVHCGKSTIVQSLLLNGAAVNAKNTNGGKAIYLAEECSYLEFTRQQAHREINKENDELTNCPRSASEFAKLVSTHLRGIYSNEILEDFNPQTIDLEPPEYQRPDFHILKMLLAAGADIEGTDMFTSDLLLKSAVRNYIREHLKMIHQKSNLYVTVKKLRSLPKILQSYLLFNNLPEKNKFHKMTDDERELFLLSSGNSEKQRPMIQNLIKRGVDVNMKNEKGMTPFMMAAQNGHVELVEELI